MVLLSISECLSFQFQSPAWLISGSDISTSWQTLLLNTINSDWQPYGVVVYDGIWTDKSQRFPKRKYHPKHWLNQSRKGDRYIRQWTGSTLEQWHNRNQAMGLLPDTKNCGLRMRQECRESFPRHRLQRKQLVSNPGMHHGTCVTHVPWCMSGSLTRGGGEVVPGIPGACATRNFAYLVRGPLHETMVAVCLFASSGPNFSGNWNTKCFARIVHL